MDIVKIKKQFRKMSRRLRRQGYQCTCSMTDRQQLFRTATIAFSSVTDYETLMKLAERNLLESRVPEYQAEAAAKEAGRRLELYKVYAEKATGKRAAHWKKLIAAYESGRFEEIYRNLLENMNKRCLERHRDNFEKYGTVEQQIDQVMKDYVKIIRSSAVDDFIEQTGANFEIEKRNEGIAQVYYLRFLFPEND